MFRISRRLDYGLQLMIALAAETEDRAISTASLAEKLGSPLPFLHQIGHSLMQAGLIRATPGPRGGLRLNQPAESITVLQIVETLEGKIMLNPAQDSSTDTLQGIPFASQLVWDEMQDRILDYLGCVNLAQLSCDQPNLEIFSLRVSEPVAKNN